MEPLKIYDYLGRARTRLFDWVRPLTAEEYAREFRPGERNLAQILTHTMTSEWLYLQRIQRLPVPPDEQWPIREEQPPAFQVLEAAWIEQAGRAREVLDAVRDWHEEFEYSIMRAGQRMIITVSASDVFTQLVLHEVHHRAQAMMLLRRLGAPAGDVDYNTMTYKRRYVPAE